MSHDTPYVDDGGRSINVKLHQPSQMFIYPPHKIPIEQCAVAIATASRGSYTIIQGCRSWVGSVGIILPNFWWTKSIQNHTIVNLMLPIHVLIASYVLEYSSYP